MTTGFCEAGTRIQSRACTPVIVHATVCSLAVRHTWVAAKWR